MAPPRNVLDWLERNYPKPRVDREWLDSCYEWLIDQGHSPNENLQAFLAELESQLLRSDLRDSMVQGTGLPAHTPLQSTSTTLSGPPVLVEIIALTEIGSSAVNLENIRKTIEERMRAGNIPEGDNGEEADLDIEGEGPIPKYPRGMLRFQLTDGTVTLEAIEYRTLPQLTLGVTPLGYKMQLKNVLIQRGMAFLEPNTVVMKGGLTEDRQNNQTRDFIRGLRIRMGLPIDPSPPAEPDLPLPELEHQRQPAAQNQLPSPQLSPTLPLVTQTNIGHSGQEKPTSTQLSTISSSAESSTMARTRSQTAKTTSPYFNSTGSTLVPGTSQKDRMQNERNVDLNLAPTTRHTLHSPSPARSIDFDPFDDMDIFNDENMPPKGENSTAREIPDEEQIIDLDAASSDSYGINDDPMDDEFLQGLDRVEMEALSGSQLSPPEKAVGVEARNLGKGAITDVEVITIEDDDNDNGGGGGDDDDEEVEFSNEIKGSAPRPTQKWKPHSQSQSQPIRGVRGSSTARTTDPPEVIEITDSD